MLCKHALVLRLWGVHVLQVQYSDLSDHEQPLSVVVFLYLDSFIRPGCFPPGTACVSGSIPDFLHGCDSPLASPL